MDPRPSVPVRQRRVWLSPYLLAVALTPAVFQSSTTLSCKSGDTTLSELAVIVDGEDAINGFDPDTTSYSVLLPLGTDEALVHSVTTDPQAQVWVDVVINEERFRYLQGNYGGSDVVVPLPPGSTTIEVWVRPQGGLTDVYEVAVDIEIGVDFCVQQPVDCSASAECLTDGLCDPTCDPIDAGSGLCDRCPGMDNPAADGTPCSGGSCISGVCEQRWTAPELLQATAFGTGSRPLVGVDPAGYATAVWQQNDGNGWAVWSSRYTPGMGWGAPEAIPSGGPPGVLTNPSMAVDPSGNVTVAWTQRSADNRGLIWANRYTPSVGWGTGEALNPNVTTGDNGLVVVDANATGNVLAVWRNSYAELRSNRYTPGAGWGAEETIAANAISRGDVALDSNGNALVVWQTSIPVPNAAPMQGDLWWIGYTPSTGWSTPDLLETNGIALWPQIAFDSSGNATAVWYQSDGISFKNNIWSRRYTPSDGWGTAELIETNAGNAAHPVVAIDPNGNAIAAWDQYDGIEVSIWSNRYTPSVGWGTAELIEMNRTGGARNPGVAVDPSGNAVVVWYQVNGTGTNVWSNRYRPNTGWGVAQPVDSGDAGNPDAVSHNRPAVGVDANGNATAVWLRASEPPFNSHGEIWSSRTN